MGRGDALESERAKTMVFQDATRGSDYVRVCEKGHDGRKSGTFSASSSHRCRV